MVRHVEHVHISASGICTCTDACCPAFISTSVFKALHQPFYFYYFFQGRNPGIMGCLNSPSSFLVRVDSQLVLRRRSNPPIDPLPYMTNLTLATRFSSTPPQQTNISRLNRIPLLCLNLQGIHPSGGPMSKFRPAPKMVALRNSHAR